MFSKTQKIKNLRYKLLNILLILVLLPTISYSQIKNIGLPFITNYVPLDFGADTQTWSCVQDNRGIMYFANNAGVLEFDGHTWKIIKITNNSTVRSLSISDEGKIYVSAENEVGYLSTDSLKNTIYVSILNKIPEKYRNFGSAWTIYNINNKIFIRSSNYIIIIDENNCKAFESDNKFHTCANIDGHFYVNILDKGIYEYKNDSLVFVKNSEYFATHKFYNILPYENNKKMVFMKDGRIMIWRDDIFFEWDRNTEFLKNSLVYYAEKMGDYYAIGTHLKGLFIIDKQGKLIQHIDNKNGLLSNIILHLYTDYANNLWVSTSSSISLIEIFSPYTILDERLGMSTSSNPYFISVFNKFLYTCVGSNILTFPVKDYYNPSEKYNFTSIENSEGQSWGIFNIEKNLYFYHNPGIHQITNNSSKEVLSLNNNNIWGIIDAPYDNKNKYIAGTDNGMYLIEYKDNKLHNSNKIKGYDLETRYFLIDSLNYIWISENTFGLYRLKLNNQLDSVIETKLFTEKDGLPSKYNTRINIINNELIISTSQQFYKYDYDKDSLIYYETFNSFFDKKAKLNISGIDSLRNIWIFEDFDGKLKDAIIILVPTENGKYKKNKHIAGKLLAYNIDILSILDKNSLFFSTNKGLIHYDSRIKRNYLQKFNTLIRKIEFIPSDSLLFGGTHINQDSIFINNQNNENIPKIKYKNNSLRFTFAATFYENTDNIQFQYKLINFNNEPSNWTTENKKEYTNLQPGKYTFIVKSKNIYQTYSEKTYYSFIIQPPWYRTILAYIAYVILGILFILSIIKFSTHRLQVRNINLENRVKERTNELHMKNVELEQQKEEILTQTEELEIINSELEKLSVIASETDNAVILMDKDGNFAWVNDAYVRMFGYTLRELIDGISANIISVKTEPEIKKIIQKCFIEKVPVEYELSTLTNYGTKIWVHTTLTPMLDEFGEIKTLVAIDSDITKIKEAEQRIKQQNYNIKGSIRYALTIQKSILPKQSEINKSYENFIIYRPKDIVSGDFYWFTEEEPYKKSIDNIAFKIKFIAAVDCTGHGVPGAFMSLIGSRLLSEIVCMQKIHNPAEILKKLDKGVKDVLKRSSDQRRDGMVISLCKIVQCTKDNNCQIKLTHSGAKLSITYYKNIDKQLNKTKATRKTIGWQTNVKEEFFNTEISFAKNDIIYLYSDGLKDQNNEKRKKFGTTRINKILLQNIDKPLPEQKQKLENALDKWQNEQEQRDDITFIGIKF